MSKDQTQRATDDVTAPKKGGIARLKRIANIARASTRDNQFALDYPRHFHRLERLIGAIDDHCLAEGVR